MERDSISNMDAVTDDDDNVLSHSDDEEILVGGETSVVFENCIENEETLFNTPSPVQPRQKKCLKTHSLKPPETVSTTLMKYIIDQKNPKNYTQIKANLMPWTNFFFVNVFNGQTVLTVLTTYCKN